LTAEKSLTSRLYGSIVVLTGDVTLFIDGSTTQIDHILICTKGVFVIETKHYSGWIYGDAKQKQWMQVLFKKRSQFQNPTHQNYKHIKAIQALFDFLPPDQIKSLVVFTDDGEFKTSRPKDVVLLDGIKEWMDQHEDNVFSLNRIQFCMVDWSFYEFLRVKKQTYYICRTCLSDNFHDVTYFLFLLFVCC
jgi:hypothetical protein